MAKKSNIKSTKLKKDETEQNLTVFKPTQKMLNTLRCALDPEIKPTITALCEAAKVTRETYYTWQNNELFCEWWSTEWDKAMKGSQIGSFLDKVAIMKSTTDYRYWEGMQMKYRGFMRKESVETKSTNLNVDLTKLSDEEIGKLADTLKKI